MTTDACHNSYVRIVILYKKLVLIATFSKQEEQLDERNHTTLGLLSTTLRAICNLRPFKDTSCFRPLEATQLHWFVCLRWHFNERRFRSSVANTLLTPVGWRCRWRGLSLREYNLWFQFAKFIFQFGKFPVWVLYNCGDVAERPSVGGNASQFFSTFFYLQFFPNLSSDDLFQLLEFTRELRIRDVIGR